MQDYPKLLETCEKVGFTMVPREFCFSTVKNDIKTAADKFKANNSPESASTCEADYYEQNRRLLKLCGAQIEQGDLSDFAGIKTAIFPRVYLAPSFAVTLKEMRSKVKKLNISKDSTFIVGSDIYISNVSVDGYVQLDQKGVVIQDKQYGKLVATEAGDPDYVAIRGFKYINE